MGETIRFAWGTSFLGDFIVATSGRGLVALEFAAHRAEMENALGVRFPNDLVIEGQPELTELIEQVRRVIEQPGRDACLPLDLRGSRYEIAVWTMLRSVPAGETTNYGALAAELGTRDAREVTAAIAGNPVAVLVPCHRVIKKDGSISGYRWGVHRKRALLAREQRSVGFRLA